MKQIYKYTITDFPIQIMFTGCGMHSHNKLTLCRM